MARMSSYKARQYCHAHAYRQKGGGLRFFGPARAEARGLAQ
jgi:hypothetical protein